MVAQQAYGKFLTDTIEIGKPFEYSLGFKHNFANEVFFPDTATHFKPFQVISLAYFPTKTINGISTDSATYRLVSFDLQVLQTLKVPIWVNTERDCTAIYSNRDSIYLKRELTKLKDAQIKTDVEIAPLHSKINFPLLLLSGLLLLILGVGIYIIFGKAINKQWNLYMLARRNRDFRRIFGRLTRDVKNIKAVENIEKAVTLWKIYLQRLEQKPVVTYTTKEIIDNFPDEALSEALKNIDSVIYGGQNATISPTALNQLLAIATQSYQNKRATIKGVS